MHSTTAAFDRSDFDGLLREHVDANILVDYGALAADLAPLKAYVGCLKAAPFSALIRLSFREDRIHFALVRAATGCPPLRGEAYTAHDIAGQLESQSRSTHEDGRWFRLDESDGTVRLTQVYSWYASDFEQLHAWVQEAAARYSPALRDAIDAGRSPRIRWLPYDWALNVHARGWQ